MEQQGDSKASEVINNGEYFTRTYIDVIKDLIKRVERLEASQYGGSFKVDESWLRDRFS